ncbi:MAG: phenylphosphate synthase subunit beta [Desulfobacula sp.]|uniref:PEP/pyruvate-binding domain-containing protein n=1 Tax=Desulfobacula sp. TaxID=2593537 RepID=UPI0025C3FDE1|nr:PEP/pyruvate-binding domain-containing protein [Desulfobacula sp.]MCD4720553.1 phenylphosphate synthase subunit beta [Desulfobacula sp.]
MRPQFKYILWFEECSKNTLSLVGGKNANLGELVNAGIRVPPGFAVTSTAFGEFMERTGLWANVKEILDDILPDEIKRVVKAGKEIRQTILSTPIPDEICDEIMAAYELLCDECGVPNLPVAIRSSATAEDLEDASFAGQQDTYLWIWGNDEVVLATHKCWASLFTDRAIIYRMRANFPQDDVLISVGIQKMVNSKSAGVMFTLDPVTGDTSKITMEANWGFGESIVQGLVSPDSFVINKNSMAITQSIIGQKDQRFVAKACGTKVEPVPLDQQGIPCISVREVMEIAKTGMRIEKHYNAPQDIEWAIDADLSFPDNIFSTQSRPVTASGKKDFSKKIMKEEGKNDIDHIIDLMIKGFEK